jgi:hypothetical protein
MNYTETKLATKRIQNLQKYGFDLDAIQIITGYEENVVATYAITKHKVKKYAKKHLTHGQKGYIRKCKDIVEAKSPGFWQRKDVTTTNVTMEVPQEVIANYAMPDLIKPVTHTIKNIKADKPISLVIGEEGRALLIDIEMLPKGIKITWQ